MSDIMELLAQAKERVIVMGGEHPESIPRDAITLAKRAGVLYRWAQNNEVYQIRWSPDHPAMNVPKGHVCKVLLQRIIDMHPKLLEEPLGKSDDHEPVPLEHLVEDDENEGVDATVSALAFAEEHGVDLKEVKGSGKDGRITLGDVKKLLPE